MTKIGFIGGGIAVKDLHLPALAELGILDKVKYVAASTVESSARAAEELHKLGLVNIEYADADSILADPEVTHVLIAVPINRTAALVRAAVAAGKNVLAEKPISEHHADALSLLNQAKLANVKLLAGENFRFQSTYRDLRLLIENGTIGDVKIVFWNDLHFTSRSGKYAATDWRVQGEHVGGYLVDGGTHIVAGLRQLRSVPIDSVHALSTLVQEYLSNQADTMLINFRYTDGVIGHLALGYGVHDPDARIPKILGTDGTLALRPDGIYLINSEGDSKLQERKADPGFLGEWKVFLDESSESVESVYYYTEESIGDLEFIEAARRSSDSEREVRIGFE